MIFDLNKTPINETNYDICVIGSGPAAFASINEIKNKKIIILEAGGKEIDSLSQEQYEGDIKEDDYYDLTTCRLRCLGGTSGLWGGWCKPLDNFDFKKRTYVKDSGWPIERNSLSKYFNESCNLLEIENDFNKTRINDKNFLETRYQFSKVRYGEKKKKFLENSKNVHCYLNANLYNAIIENSKIKKLIIKNYKKENFFVKAKIFVFAMGGIENSRLTKWIIEKNSINSTIPIGNYWMEHPNLSLGHIVLNKDNNLISINRKQKRFFFSLTDEYKIKNRLLNGNIVITTKLNENSNLYKKIVFELKCNTNILPSNIQCINKLNFHGEQEPNYKSKITLSRKKKDYFGIPKSELHWKKTKLDLESCQKTIEKFKDFITTSNIGSLRLKNWIFKDSNKFFKEPRGGNHHMGGTRMSTNLENGVVDENCRFHLLNNLFFAGSSIFPTSGEANPTFTITNLGLRLRDHIVKII